MTETGIPAAENDVEALILGDTFANDEDTCITDAVDREVSMRGDLQQMPLADVFQSLGMSKMEGVLRVKNLVETREIYFRDGLVRSYIPARVELRRIGVQLVQGGLMTAETLRALLFEQKKARHDLRQLLVDHRVLPEAEVDDLFNHRAAEELYGLFTWTQGAFEFYKGPPGDPLVVARFDELKAFDINVVLMEVARRSDEWEVILEAIRSVDELVVPNDGSHQVTGDHLEVLNALDGRRTIRMLAPSMLFGLFELSRIIRNLLDSGHVRFATVPEGLDAIRQYLAHNRKKLASALLETLATRPEGHSYADLHAIATLLQEAGEQKRAANTLLTAAREAEDSTTALEMLRDARALAPRSCEVLEQLREILLRLEDPERDAELRQITDDFCNALIEDGRLTDSLTILDQLDTQSPGDARLTFRRAIVLHKLGRRDEAMTSLMALAEKLKAAKQRDQLVVVYEQVLKIDPRRRDVTRALRAIQATKIVRQIRMGAVVTAILASGVAGVVGWRNHWRTKTIDNTGNEVQALLASGDIEAATAAITRAETVLGDTQPTAELRQLILEHVEKKREAAAIASAGVRRERLAAAAMHIEKGEFEAAMSTYASVLAETDEASSTAVRDVVRARCQSLLPSFEKLAQDLPYALPPAPGPTSDSKARRQAIDDLQTHFRDIDLLRAKACLRGIEHELFRTCVDADTSTRLTKACTEVVRTFGLADVRRTAYQSLEANAEVARRLQPLVVQSNQLEAQHRYAEAAAAYQTLVREHPHEDELKQQFRNSEARCAKIALGLETVAAATNVHDAKAAREALRTLRSEFPDVPIGKLTRLPVAIDSNPTGATVSVDGETVGTTPLHTTFVPATGARVKINLEGFDAATIDITQEDAGEIAITLTKHAAWTAILNGAITQTPATDGKDVLFAVDRSGRVTGLDLGTGAELWHVDTEDLSGLLPRPVQFGERVIVTSVDGPVRCLRWNDGTTLWKAANLATEIAPVRVGELLLIATIDGRLIALDSASGGERFSTDLPGRTSGIVVHNRVACCVTMTGDALGISVTRGKELWRTNLGQVIATTPALAEGVAYIVGEEGVVVALEADTGNQRWRRVVGSLIPVAPAVHATEVFVAANDDVVVLSASTGEVLRKISIGETVTSMVCDGDRLLTGTAKGSAIVFTTGRETVRMRGPGRVTAKPLITEHWLVVGFEGKTIQAYKKPW